MLVDERRNKIRNLIIANGSVKVTDLVREFQVSEETIRRDLTILESKGLIKKNYGGAVLAQDYNQLAEPVPPVKLRQSVYFEEKNAIGKKAAELLSEQQIIILDSGTTTLCIARNLSHLQDITVVTNGINVAEECCKNEGSSIYLVGGKLIKESMSLIGPQAQNELKKYSANYAFLGTTGISLTKGFSTSDLYEAEVKRAMVQAGNKVVVVADHSKFKKQGLITFCGFDDVDMLVTSDQTDEEILKEIEKLGVKVIVSSTTAAK